MNFVPINKLRTILYFVENYLEWKIIGRGAAFFFLLLLSFTLHIIYLTVPQSNKVHLILNSESEIDFLELREKNIKSSDENGLVALKFGRFGLFIICILVQRDVDCASIMSVHGIRHFNFMNNIVWCADRYLSHSFISLLLCVAFLLTPCSL